MINYSQQRVWKKNNDDLIKYLLVRLILLKNDLEKKIKFFFPIILN